MATAPPVQPVNRFFVRRVRWRHLDDLPIDQLIAARVFNVEVAACDHRLELVVRDVGDGAHGRASLFGGALGSPPALPSSSTTPTGTIPPGRAHRIVALAFPPSITIRRVATPGRAGPVVAAYMSFETI